MSEDGSKAENKKILTGLLAELDYLFNREEDSNEVDLFESGKLQTLSPEQIKKITKSLSQTRHILNQRIETLRQEMEECSARIESLKLVGSSTDEAISKLNELFDQGEKISAELARVDEKIREARELEVSRSI